MYQFTFVCVNLQAIFYATKVKQMLSQSATTVQQPFCSKQIVKVDQGASSVAISPLNPTDKNSLVNVIFQVCTLNCVYLMTSLP